MQLMLENLGYQVTARTSSIEALEVFRNKPQSFDLVITDMTMPNMTRKDLAKELMGIRPDIPIIKAKVYFLCLNPFDRVKAISNMYGFPREYGVPQVLLSR